MTEHPLFDRFSLKDRVAVITGGAGLLGLQHALAIAEAGGTPCLWDIDSKRLQETQQQLETAGFSASAAMLVDITKPAEVSQGLSDVLKNFGRCDILINNAAIDPKVDSKGRAPSARLEDFDLDRWNLELSVGLTGAFLCAQILGGHMADQGGGVILNISSDLGIISPDQRIYRQPGLPDDQQPVKPITYSVIKHGLLGLTKYLATYWAGQGVRCNSLAPAGVQTNQPEAFVQKLSNLIPMGRMAKIDEYRGAVQFLCSDASSYMNGSCLVVDGGRSVW